MGCEHSDKSDCTIGLIYTKTHWESGEEVRKTCLRKMCGPLYFLASAIACAAALSQMAM